MSTFATPSPSKISRYSRYGSWQVLAEAQFQRGLVTDTAPVALPAGAVADARDYLFDRPGKIRKRGATAYVGARMGSSTETAHVSYVPFQAGEKLIAVAIAPASNYHVWDVLPNSDLGAIATITSSTQPPVFYNDSLYILTGSTATSGLPVMVRNSAGTCTLVNSVATYSIVGCTHAGYLVLANDNNLHKNRLWFSPIPDPETTWDTANAYIDTNGPITGLASVQGVLVVFHAGSSERILGSIPPGTVGENMSLQPLSGQAGCLDPASIRPVGGNVYFADAAGAWVTNGASVTSITSRADATGISVLWRQKIAEARLASQPAVRAGTFGNDYYIVQVLKFVPGATSVLTLVYHISTGIWSRFELEAIGDFSASTQAVETYAAPSAQGYVLALSDLFAEAPTGTTDAGAAHPVLPTVTSRVMGTGPFEKAFGDGHLTYDMRTSAGATLALTYSRDIEQQTFQSSATFAGVTVPTRQRFPVSGDGHGFSWTIAQTGASTKTELYAVELEHRNYEEQADG